MRAKIWPSYTDNFLLRSNVKRQDSSHNQLVNFEKVFIRLTDKDVQSTSLDCSFLASESTQIFSFTKNT